jgi:hypothetical protein
MKQVVNKEDIVVPEGTIENFNRPKHNDFSTDSELRDKKFSGTRSNSVTGDFEFWILGEKVKAVTALQASANPKAINEAYEEVFALASVQPDIAELKAFRKLTGKD